MKSYLRESWELSNDSKMNTQKHPLLFPMQANETRKFSLELYNTSNAKELSIFTVPIQMQKILFLYFSIY